MLSSVLHAGNLTAVLETGFLQTFVDSMELQDMA